MQQIAEIECLLEGRLDSDNIQREGSTVSKIGGGSVHGIADFARPVVADKLIADFGNDPSFESNIYNDLLTKISSRPQLDVLEAKFAFDINNKIEGIKPENENVITNTGGVMSDADKAKQELAISRADKYKADVLERKRRMSEGQGSSIDPLAVPFASSVSGGVIPAAPFPGLEGIIMEGIKNYRRSREYDTPVTLSGSWILGSDYIQTKYIKHPPNYKVCYFDDIYGRYRSQSKYLPLLTSDIAKVLPVATLKVSMKGNYSDDEGWISVNPYIVVSPVDAETTAVTMVLGTRYASFSDDDYLNVLVDVDIIFKVLP